MTRIEAAGIINAIKCSMVTTLKEHEALTMAECVLFKAEPVKHGHWEIAIGYDPRKAYQCSNCSLLTFEPTNYCPHCGAIMGLDEVEE